MRLGLNLGWVAPGTEDSHTAPAAALTGANMTFCRQLGITHIIGTGGPSGFPGTPADEGYWRYEDLVAMRQLVESNELTLEAIENFPPAHWDKILLGAPGREEQTTNLKTTITNMGRAGIGTMGYCFTLTGTWGRNPTVARGGAVSQGWNNNDVRDDAHPEWPGEAARVDVGSPIPEGYVWKQWIDGSAGDHYFHGSTGEKRSSVGTDIPSIGPVSEEQMWERITWFLRELVPTAEAAGVRLAAHPNDPPVPSMRGVSSILYTPESYQRLLDIVPSPCNTCEFCQGTVSEMLEGDEGMYEAIRRYASQDKISYVHFRNVIGKAPVFNEVFIDEGDVDMEQAIAAYRDAGFNGVLTPDHTPLLECGAPWHAGVAFAVGYIKASAKAVGVEFERRGPASTALGVPKL
jgi:mannonate dehydratase